MNVFNKQKTLTNSNQRYRRLNPEEVVSTTQLLSERIQHRFPESDLWDVSQQLLEVAQEGYTRSLWMDRPLLGLRVLAVLLVVISCCLIFYSAQFIKVENEQVTIPEILQAIEAATSELIILGAGLVFLFTIEIRVKRRRGFQALHELRAMAHIIDMHQLTKDPARLNNTTAIWTPVSPQPGLDAFLLSRYLDYCSEMLAILGKVAALYAQRFADPVLLAGVDEIETLTSGLSRKIWQKIMIIKA
jgi:hypothetical protein